MGSPAYTTGELCGLFGHHRQSYYKTLKIVERDQLQSEILLECIRKIRKDLPKAGGRMLYERLGQCLPTELLPGRDGLFNFLRDNDLLVRRCRKRVFTTNSFHHFRVYTNLIKAYVPDAPGQVWVCDITYIEVSPKCFYYLFLITDAYSRKIVGWYLGNNLKAAGALEALRMALDNEKPTQGLIHHSDRGVQYCCHEYVSLLKKNQVSISMSKKGDPLENAIAERVNGILKTEWLNDLQFESLQDARKKTARVIELYNTRRPHSSINRLTPEEAHQRTGKLERKWKNYRKKIPANPIQEPVDGYFPLVGAGAPAPCRSGDPRAIVKV